MVDRRLAPRLRRLPRRTALGTEFPVAVGPLSRLLGLSGLERARAGRGLLIPRCRSVHTCGMRFTLDVLFLDEDGTPIRICVGVRPWRLVSCRTAAAVLETPCGLLGLDR